eukprot:3225559-Prymnesium_polylepis.1
MTVVLIGKPQRPHSRKDVRECCTFDGIREADHAVTLHARRRPRAESKRYGAWQRSYWDQSERTFSIWLADCAQSEISKCIAAVIAAHTVTTPHSRCDPT